MASILRDDPSRSCALANGLLSWTSAPGRRRKWRGPGALKRQAGRERRRRDEYEFANHFCSMARLPSTCSQCDMALMLTS